MQRVHTKDLWHAEDPRGTGQFLGASAWRGEMGPGEQIPLDLSSPLFQGQGKQTVTRGGKSGIQTLFCDWRAGLEGKDWPATSPVFVKEGI